MKKQFLVLLCVLLVAILLPMAISAAPLLPESKEQTTEKADCVYYVIEPELFELGGWKLDSAETGSFRDKYMYDQGTGQDPATAKLVVPSDGTYNIWIHSRDYETNKPGTRTIEFKIDGKTLGTVGNHMKEGWAWQKFDRRLLGGEHTIEAVDGHTWARFDLIVVTNDMDYMPSNTLEGLKALDAKTYDAASVQWTTADPLEGRPNTEIAVKYNGEWMSFDVEPILLNDRTMVPLRAIFEALGATVTWDDETQTAKGDRNGREVTVTIGSNIGMVNGSMVSIDQSAVLMNDRTLVPLRFISEAYGAEVSWDDPSQTVFIEAGESKNGIYIGGSSYIDYGTWSVSGVNSDGSVYLVGTTPDSRADGQPVTLEDADASQNKPAVAEFTLQKAGKYKMWVRGRDFKTNQQGTRFFNVSVNGQMDAKTFGKHAGEGFIWEEAGIYDLQAGKNSIEVHDTSGFFARVAGILLVEDLAYQPVNDHVALVDSFGILDPASAVKAKPFPAWATKQLPDSASATIESDTTRVAFYQVSDGVHTFVQNEVYAKDASGQWVLIKQKTDDFGLAVLTAAEAKMENPINGYATVVAQIPVNGTTTGVSAVTAYKMGLTEWFVPESFVQVDANTIQLNYPESNGIKLTATWKFDGRPDPLVSVDATYQNAGHYSIIASNGREYTPTEFDAATAPFRVVEQRIPEDQAVLMEKYMSTPMSVITLKEGVAAPGKVSIGVVVDGTNIESEWVYNENTEFGFMVRGVRNGLQGGIMAPLMGSAESKVAAGGSYSFSYRPVVTLTDWFDAYKHVVSDIYDVHDYRSNYYHSLNEAIYNTTDLMMDDEMGGWDPIDMAHYNMETQDLTSSANPMIAVQRYLLTEDPEILEKRAIPTLAWSLTRKMRNFKRVNTPGGVQGSYVQNPPSEMGTPPSEFLGTTFGGLYEMTQGNVPVLGNIAVEKQPGSGYTGIYNNLSLYRYTGDKKFLDAAIKCGDSYLKETLDNPKYMSTLPDWSSFINISYFPNIGSLVDLYEASGEQRFLDAALQASQIAVTSFWATGIDNGKADTPYTVTADHVYNVRGFMEGHNFFWHGNQQWRLGGDDGEVRASKDGKVKLPESETVPGWLPTRVGLGLEQASTFAESLNIVMASWVGDITRVAHYTGEDYLATAARNGMVGRFGNYPGYYQNRYMTHQMKANYPYEGPDYSSIYWHHIPPFLAMIEEFLITDFWYTSDAKVEFPRVRQGGYAYFFSSQYGFDSGKMYDVDGLWLWNDRDVVNPDTVQLDYLPAKKDGVLGVSFMNRDKVDTTSTITLGSKVPGGDSYTGTATLYDVAGNKSTVEVVNGKFTITVPAKTMVTVIMNIDGVKAPSYASGEHRDGNAEMGATVSEHTRGRAYALQLSGNEYYAYIYVTDMDAKDPDTEKRTAYRAKDMTVTYTINGETKTIVRNEYPFEVLVKVDDVNAILTYTVQITKADGTTEDMGGGELMTNAKSTELGKKFEGNAIASTGSSGGSTVVVGAKPPMSAKLPDTDPFKIDYIQQGLGSTFRFVVKPSSIPFPVTENLLAGMTATITLTENATGKSITAVGYVVGNEMRADGNTTVLIPALPEIPMKDYDNDKAKTHKFHIVLSKKEGASAVPGDKTPTVTPGATTPATPAGPVDLKPFKIEKYVAQGSGSGLLRFVVDANQIPFTCTENCLKDMVCEVEAIAVDGGDNIKTTTTLAGNEMRADGRITILVNPTDDLPAGDYDNDKAKTHKVKLDIKLAE